MTTVPLVALAMLGCSKHVEHDCSATLEPLRQTGPTVPRNADERTAMVADVVLSLRGWEKARATVRNEEVARYGEELASELKQRLALLKDAQFVTPSPEPSAAAFNPEDPESRKQALREAVAAGMAGLLGESALAPDSARALRSNAADLDRLRASLVDWCAANQ